MDKTKNMAVTIVFSGGGYLVQLVNRVLGKQEAETVEDCGGPYDMETAKKTGRKLASARGLLFAP